MSFLVSIGPFRLSPATRELSGGGRTTRLGDRACNLLRVLAERRDEVVSKPDLLAQGWPDITVDEGALRFQILALRRLLAADGDQVRILSASGRGYMLTVGEAARPPAEEVETAPGGPRRAPRLIGRTEEVGVLAAMVRASRCVTLAGPGGVGKTALALALVDALNAEFPRTWLVDFSSVDDPAKALLSAAIAFGVTAGTRDPIAGIVAHLRRERGLVVIDNCEHVIDAAARLAEALLRETPEVRLVATSREPLRVSEEMVYRLQPLAVPPRAAQQTVSDLLSYAAVRLFAERALAKSGYQFTDADAPAVARICRQLDGVPLALELAAGWTAAFTLKALADDLRAHLLRTEGGPRGAPLRHRTLEAMLSWSFDRLSRERQAQLTRLAVFRGAFDLDAALSVLGGDRSDAVAGLADLTAKSLVEVRHAGQTAAYRLLFMPRAFAEEKLRKATHEREARLAHARVVMRQLSDHAQEGAGAGDGAAVWQALYGSVVHDLRAALAWLFSDQGDLALACDLAHDGALAWFRLSMPAEGVRFLAEAIERLQAKRPGDKERQLKLMILRLTLRVFLGRASPEALLEIDRMTDVALDRTSRQLSAWAHWAVCNSFGRHREALAHAQRFTALAEPDELADQIFGLMITSLSNLGLGQLETALSGLERTVQVCGARNLYSPATLFWTDQLSSSLTELASAHWLMGDLAKARLCADRAVHIALATQHEISISVAIIFGRAQIALLAGDAAGAQAALEELELRPLIAATFDRTIIRGFNGAALALRGEYAEAAAHIRTCFEEGGMGFAASHFVFLLGGMCEALGRAGEAELGLLHLDVFHQRYSVDPESVVLPELRRAKAALLVTAHGAAAKPEAEALLHAAFMQARKQGSVAFVRRIEADRANGF
jgi:predicted ATPase/DNA-binding winged helix-turn-helix (wHTH) protein